MNVIFTCTFIHRYRHPSMWFMTGSRSTCTFFCALSHLSEAHICKSMISTKFSFVFKLKYHMTQFSLWIVSWAKYIKKSCSCCVNWLTVLQIFIFWVFPKMHISIFTLKKSSLILKESLCRHLNGMGKIKNYLQYASTVCLSPLLAYPFSNTRIQ